MGLRPQGGTAVNPKTVLTYTAISFLVWWTVQQPANAIHLIHDVAGWLTSAARGLANFAAHV